MEKIKGYLGLLFAALFFATLIPFEDGGFSRRSLTLEITPLDNNVVSRIYNINNVRYSVAQGGFESATCLAQGKPEENCRAYFAYKNDRDVYLWLADRSPDFDESWYSIMNPKTEESHLRFDMLVSSEARSIYKEIARTHALITYLINFLVLLSVMYLISKRNLVGGYITKLLCLPFSLIKKIHDRI